MNVREKILERIKVTPAGCWEDTWQHMVQKESRR